VARVMNLFARPWLAEPYLSLWFTFLFVMLAAFVPRVSERFFRVFETFFTRLAARTTLAVIFLFLLVLVVRLALLDRLPVPNPGIHDEFSYLLMGDTFAHGRLTNPPHPLWRSFQTFHVLFIPTYASKYPPAQGVVLALGEILGHPWIGVLLSAAAMVAVFVWMLQAWIPARWAFLVGTLAAIRLCVASYWINSYWGGAVAAVGGAIVLGAVGRLRRRQTLFLGILLGVGIAILLNSRPFESLFFLLPIGVYLMTARLSNFSAGRRSRLTYIVPCAAVLVVALSAMAFYNWRVTGNPFDLPIAYFARVNDRAAIFFWQTPKPPIHSGVAAIDYFYNQSNSTSYDRSWPAIQAAFHEKLWRCSTLFFWPACWLLLPAALFLYRDARLRLVFLALLATVFSYCLVVWPGPHYLAPAAGAWFALLVQCIRHLRVFRPFGRPIGPALSRVVVLALALDVSQLVAKRISDPQSWGGWGLFERARLEDRLESTPGKHVVLVRYGPDHSVHEEWVFNRAEIDASKVVWARDLPGPINDRLFAYYPDRTIWLELPETEQLELLRLPVKKR